jgi:hypothetical protein
MSLCRAPIPWLRDSVMRLACLIRRSPVRRRHRHECAYGQSIGDERSRKQSEYDNARRTNRDVCAVQCTPDDFIALEWKFANFAAFQRGFAYPQPSGNYIPGSLAPGADFACLSDRSPIRKELFAGRNKFGLIFSVFLLNA